MHFNFRTSTILLTTKYSLVSSILQIRSMIITPSQCQNSIQLRYPPYFQIEKLTQQELLKTPSIMKSVHNITAQNDLYPSNRINKYIEEATHIYLAWIIDQLVGFRLVDFEFGLSVYNEQPLVRSILSCTYCIWRKKGIQRLIAGSMVRDIQQYQKQNSTKYLFWLTTVTPFVVPYAQDFYTDIQPANDELGSYDPKYVPVIEQIQSKMNWKLDDERNMNENEHPFIQYGIYKNTAFYTDEELKCIQKFKSDPEYHDNLSDRFQIDRRKGDRILYLMGVTDKIIEFVPNSHAYA